MVGIYFYGFNIFGEKKKTYFLFTFGKWDDIYILGNSYV